MAERRPCEHLWIARDLFGIRLSVVVREIACAVDGKVDLDELTRCADGLDAALTRVLLVGGGRAGHA